MLPVEINKIEGADYYIKKCHNQLVNDIYECIQKKPKDNTFNIFLSEVDDSILEIYFEVLKILKKEKILTDYKTKCEYIENKQKKRILTEADKKYDLEEYAEEILDEINDQKDSEFDLIQQNYNPCYVIIEKKNINLIELRKNITNIASILSLEIEEKGRTLNVYLNNDYDNPVRANDSVKNESYWNKILNLAKDTPVKSDENLIKYFNSNKRNPIYSNGTYKPTRILNKKNGLLEKVIPITVVNKSTINRKLGQKKKK
jgi:hypothetical protein